MFHLDYETYSEADIKKTGASRYAEDPSTEILLLAIAKDEGEPHLWVNPKHTIPGVLETDPEAEDLLMEMTLSDEPVYAHNAPFEEAITLEKAHGWSVDISRWRCTAALARKAGLRSKLMHLSEDLELEQGKLHVNLIPFFCVPTPSGKRRTFAQYPEKARQFADYCLQDVRAEQEVHRRLKPFELKGSSLDTWQFTMRLNRRGIPVNVPALKNAQAIIDEVMGEVGGAFAKLTGGLAHSQREKVFNWLKERGYEGENMQADTVEQALTDTSRMNPEGAEALSLYSTLAYAAAKKVTAMLAMVCRDGTVKDGHLYHGALTGRWSGQGLQVQNMKKPTIPQEVAHYGFELICEGVDRATLEMLTGFPALEVIASVVRQFISLPDGILDADYAAIEARGVNWGARQEDVVQMFREGVDQYVRMSGAIHNVPAGSPEARAGRQLGKQAVLGCFATGTKVLTAEGIKPIERVTECDMVWDGCEFVRCEGAVRSGRKACMRIGDVEVTPDHLFWDGHAWVPARILVNSPEWLDACLKEGRGTLRMEHVPRCRYERRRRQTWDIKNCGPRHRFAVVSDLGMLIAHNCGYGMGPDKFIITCHGYGIEVDLELAQRAVSTYRNLHDKVVGFWRELDTAAKDAVRHPGTRFDVRQGRASFICTTVSGMPYLLMRLPSGRNVAYRDPQIKTVKKRFKPDEPMREVQELSYLGKIPGKVILGRIKLYGGKWAENWTQAIAADLMSYGALNAERLGFDIFALIHDQALGANDPRGAGAFAAALSELPEWAKGLPLKAEGDWAEYYKKD